MPASSSLPTCTSARIALVNLDIQIARLRESYTSNADAGSGTRLVDGLLGRHSVTADHADMVFAEKIVDDLIARFPGDADARLAAAGVSAVLHRFARVELHLARAGANSAPWPLVDAVRADLLEARGAVNAALELRIACNSLTPSAQAMSRIACCQLALGKRDNARATFDAAMSTYRSPSPIPLSSMLFNWGHTWQHLGEYQQAEQAYRTLLGYLSSHVGANRALAACALATGDDGSAISAARRATRVSPDDPISVGLLGLSLRQAGLDCYQELVTANRLFQRRMREHPEAWAGHAAEFWLTEGEHPGDAARAAQIRGSVLAPQDAASSLAEVC